MASSRIPASTSGEASAEYRAAREGAAFVALPDRGVLEATGPQRQKFLQGMFSNDVADRRPGQGCAAALLTARGAVQALVRVLVDADAVLIEAPAERLSLVQRTLEHHRVAAPVRLAPRPAAVLAVIGPRAGELLAAAGAALPPAEREAHVTGTIAGHPARVVRAGDLPIGGFVIHVGPEAADTLADALISAGARPLGRETLDALRVESLRPWYGPDVDERNLLHETGLVAECHSPTKGCYLGQEIVARLEARGSNVNKLLRGLRLGTPVAAGAPVTAEGRDVGRVTTATVSPRFGPIAMGYVQRSHFASGTAVLVAGTPARVVDRFEEPA